MRRPTVLLLLLALGACARPRLPDVFATGRDPRWPEARFVLGVGEGRSPEDARRRAVAAIAAQLRSTLHSTAAIEGHAERRITEDGRSESYEEALRREIRVVTSFDRPEWVRVAETHRQGERVHVLCVLDRERAAAQLAAEIEVARTSLRLGLEELEDETDPRRLAEGLVRLERRRAALLPALALSRALADDRTALPPELEAIERVAARLSALRSSFVLRVCLAPARDAPESALAAERFVAALASHVRIVPCDAAEAAFDATLRGHVDSLHQRIPPTPGAWSHFCSGRIDWALTDARGRLLHGGSEGGRAFRHGGADRASACRGSLERLAAAVGERLGLADASASR